MLRCRDGSLYTGVTNDLDQRLRAHASGRGAAYTRSRLPVRLVYREKARGRSRALKREYALKQLSRATKQALVRRYKGGLEPAGGGGSTKTSGGGARTQRAITPEVSQTSP